MDQIRSDKHMLKNFDIVIVHLAKKDGTVRVVIPKTVREKLKIQAGDKMIVSYDKKNRVYFKKIDVSLLS